MKTSKEPVNSLRDSCREKSIPLSGYFELTPRCSLDCKMCYVHLTEKQMKERGYSDLSTEQWISLIDQAVDAGMLFPVLTGGECLMHRGFKEIFLHMKEKGLLITLNTNATLLNDEYIDFFKKYPPNLLKVSLYGITEDGYETVTGHRVCHIVKDNLIKLRDAGINLKISVTVSRQLFNEAADIVRFAIENDIPYNVDMSMFDAEEETGRSIDDYNLTAEEVVSKYLEIRKIEKKEVFDNLEIPAAPKRVNDGTIAKSLRCSAGRASFMIKWTGKMQPCIMEIQNAPDAVSLGFQKAWEKVIEISKNTVIPVECIGCKIQKACTQCAYIRANPNDPGHANPEVCKVTEAKLKAGIFRYSQNT